MAEWFHWFFVYKYPSVEFFIFFLTVLVLCFAVVKAVESYCTKENEKFVSSTLWQTLGMYGLFICIALGALIPIDVYVSYFGDRKMGSDPGEWGQMGDFFGGILNPILAFASFIALLYTIALQSKEMRDTREEARMSRVAQESSAINASNQLKQQELLEAFKGIESLFRARDIEAKSYFFETNEQGVSLQKILTDELGKLLQNEEQKADDANSKALKGTKFIDAENVTVSALRLRTKIASKFEDSFSLSNKQLRKTARSYQTQSAYSLQAYRELIKVGNSLSNMDGLMNIYAQELAQNLLFSSLCNTNSVVYNPESIKEICPRLSNATEYLFSYYRLVLRDSETTLNANG